MLDLQGDQIGLRGPQQTNTQNKYDRQPDRELHPVRRVIDQFRHDGKPADQKTNDKYNENSRAIPTVDGTEILTADITVIGNIQETGKKFPLSAGRAFAGKP